MKKYNFKSMDEFVDKLSDYQDDFEKYCERSGDDLFEVAVVAHYSIMIEILNYLVKNTDFHMREIDISSPDISGYTDEWILTLLNGELWLQEVKYGNRYLYDYSNVIFVHSDTNSAFVVKNKGENMVEFDICCDSCECNCNDRDIDTSKSESTHISRDKDGTILGFSKSWSTMEDGIHRYSSYSHYSDDFEDMNKIAKDFGVEL